MRPATIVLLSSLAIVPGAASAAPVYVGQTLQIHSLSNPIPGGGPFLVDLTDSVEDFVSFCLEFDAPLQFNVDLLVVAIGGSASGPQSPNPISPRTAFWFWRFTLGDPVYPGYLVQWMIWCEEGQYDCSAIPTLAQNLRNATTNAVMASHGWDPTSIGSVLVLTLEDPFGNDRQDVLIANPEPGSLALMGSGLAAAAWRLRRRRQRRG